MCFGHLPGVVADFLSRQFLTFDLDDLDVFLFLQELLLPVVSLLIRAGFQVFAGCVAIA